MTRRHYDSAKLQRYARRKQIRRSLRYRVRRWMRRPTRLDAFSGHVRMWALATLVGYLVLAGVIGPGSGLLPSPWDVIASFVVGGLAVVGQMWSAVRSEREKAEK